MTFEISTKNAARKSGKNGDIMKKPYFRTALVLFATVTAFLFVSCASMPKATVEQKSRMFWTIEGTDKNGNPSKVHILGTIHVGDERLYPLPEEAMKAWASSTRLAGEISTEDIDNLQNEITSLMIVSAATAKGRKVTDFLTEEQKQAAIKCLGEASVKQMEKFEPWVLNTMVSNFAYSDSGLSAEKGVDMYLMADARKNGRKWEGLDTLQTQLDIIVFGDYDTQLTMLKDVLDDIAEPEDVYDYINRLYNAYLAGSTKDVALLETEETEESVEKAGFYEQYYKQLIPERNKKWAKTIKQWLWEGGETFIFAGCAHFSGDQSVFVYLKENGVTDEIISE